jgi:hypothetical protein
MNHLLLDGQSDGFLLSCQESEYNVVISRLVKGLMEVNGIMTGLFDQFLNFSTRQPHTFSLEIQMNTKKLVGPTLMPPSIVPLSMMARE